MRMRALALTIAVAAAVQPPAIESGRALLFVAELRQAIAREDRAAVAALVEYPLTVFAGSMRIPIRDAAAMVESYPVVFADALKAAIASNASILVAPGFVTVGIDAIRIEPRGGA